jgi:acetyltransferase-like isoleucine patch superfamily enzyme
MSGIKLAILLLCTFFPSWARLAVWRMLGFKVGRRCHVSIGSIVIADFIDIGRGAVIEPLTLIYRPRIFCMGERARIAGLVRIIGYHGTLTLGAQSFVALGCLIDVSGDFQLGERSAIGPRSTLYSHGATGLIYNVKYPHRIGPVRIGADCWLGMGCIVQPHVTIGDRVIVMPGLVIRSDVASNTAIIPNQAEHRSIPTGRLLIGVTDEVRQRKLDGVLQTYSHGLGSSRLDTSHADFWQLILPDGNTVNLCRNGQPPRDWSILPAASSVVWTLFADGIVAGVPSFCFDRLTVFGPSTAFAERIADYLCRHEGIHFVFSDAHPAQMPTTSPMP